MARAISCKRPAEPGQGVRTGDLIFEESTSRQSEMVGALNGSRWTHMGVVFEQASGPVVLEAASPVRYTPLRDYCSELTYKLFDSAVGLKIGRLERASNMNLDDPRVKRALVTRFAKGKFDPDESVVTPASIFDDARFVTIDER